MKSVSTSYLPPDFDVELFLDELFPERVLARVRAAESLPDGTEDDMDEITVRILAAVRAHIAAHCRFCSLTPHSDCDVCKGAA